MPSEITKKIFTSGLVVDEIITEEPFALASFKKKASRNNRPYIDVQLFDKSGSLSAKIWSDNLKNTEIARPGDIVLVDGTVEDFKKQMQLNITSLKTLKNVHYTDFPWAGNRILSKKDEVSEYGQILRLLNSIKQNRRDNVSEDKQTNNKRSTQKICITTHFIGYKDGIKYQPNKGITQFVVKALANLNNSRRKNGKISFSTTLTNIQYTVANELNEVTVDSIKNAIYTIRDNPNFKCLPIEMSVKNETVYILEH